MSDIAAVIFANKAFYAAFAGRDMAAMNDTWARVAGVSCIHPGWPPITGREAVMKSWRSILLNPASPAIVCHRPQAFLLGEAAYVVCFEQVGETVLAATNVFVREEGSWKMVHHQAGPAPVVKLGEAAPGPIQ